MSELEPITREELLLNSIAGEGDSGLFPITRQEMYLSAIAGESELPEGMEPITREEIYYQKILDNGGAGGGGEATGTKTINITQNGTTTSNVKAYATAEIITNVPNPSTGTKQISQNGIHDVTDFASAQVNVPNSYESSDEGKVVSNGDLVSQTSRSVTQNGTIDTTLNNSVSVNVPQGITPTGTKSISITANGTSTEDVTNYASAQIAVNVPNSYSASDEGKVVSNGALASQSSQTVTENGTYDTTTKNEVVVNVEGSSSEDTFSEYLSKTLTNYENNTITVVPANSCRAGNFQSFRVPNATSIEREVFSGAIVQHLFAPNAVLAISCCYNAQIITAVIKEINGQAVFRGTAGLTIVDITGSGAIAGTAFDGRSTLQAVILRSLTLISLSGTNAFTSTPFASGGTGGTIYIPKSLYDHLGDGSALDYKSATNWSTIDGYGTITWAQIEGSIYETQYGDGTPISA